MPAAGQTPGGRYLLRTPGDCRSKGAAGWQRLIAARAAYHRTAGAHYDEVLDQVAERAVSEGSIGKAGIGALLLFKRLRADTPWAAR